MPSPSRPVTEDVFQLDLNANQPCPFKKDTAKEWTLAQQAICEQDISNRRASTVEEMGELVSEIVTKQYALTFVSAVYSVFRRY